MNMQVYLLYQLMAKRWEEEETRKKKARLGSAVCEPKGKRRRKIFDAV